MSKLRVVKTLVAERLTAVAEEILEEKSDMSPEQQRAAVHRRLSAVVEEIFRILEKMVGEYETEDASSHEEIDRKRQLMSMLLKTETNVPRTDTLPLSGSNCVKHTSSEQSKTSSQDQKTSRLPRTKDASTETDCEFIRVRPSHTEAQSPGDNEPLSSNESEAASEDQKHLKSNKRKISKRQNRAEDYCGMCGRSSLRGVAGKKIQKTEGKISAANKIQLGGRSRCRVCGKHFRSKRSFLKHVLRHEETSDLCGACGKHLDPDESLKTHLQTHNEEEEARGDEAQDERPEASGIAGGRTCGSDEQWGRGEGSNGNDLGETKDGPCLENSKTKRSNKPRGPKKKDNKDPSLLKYSCKVCGKYFCYRASFLKHVQEDEGDAGVCGVCGKRFESNDGLRRHLQTYVRTNDCEVCGKRFESHQQLEMHARTHTGEKPYVCNVCGKAFAQNGNLMGHMRAHTGERPYACSVCGQSFGFKEYMTAHMRIHTGEKPFLCSVCGKGFRQRGTLKTHSMIHTGESAHRCAVCDKAFYKSGALKIHMRSHTGERPYLCNVCGKSFGASGSLTKHMGVHEGEGARARKEGPKRRAQSRGGESTQLTSL
uniref:zinc finger protein 2 homolog n=1 Tax=Gasterosteus aculeatus aculeatus TaxID=481459 RepID=UPI001A97DE3A|nr:zinc finger protein 2 homolog [Gasterosteus aculeatus aculeatus]